MVLVVMVTGCGSQSDLERFGEAAAGIQRCEGPGGNGDVVVTDMEDKSWWPHTIDSNQVVCGDPDTVSNPSLMLNTGRYKSARAAVAAAHTLGRNRLVCVVNDYVLESWMSPADSSDVPVADRTSERWARIFCKRVHGRSIGRFYAWDHSLKP